ncbi:hypothetical protein [Robertkochia flava]|nr:hypothetical protein [Robertkochia marina]
MLKRFLYFVLPVMLIAMGFAIRYSAWYRRVRLSDTIPEVDRTREARV